MKALKRKEFARWQLREDLPDALLCEAIREMEAGLIDAELGGHLFKNRIARPGRGKSGGYRRLLSARISDRYVFLLGFSKNERANISNDETKALQFAGKIFLNFSAEEEAKALQSGVLVEVHCGKQNH